MAYDLPSLNALRAFEAAARHLSFKEAGRELHVTRGAVSQQVKGLESELGVPLFHRHNRQIVLTEEGQALLPKLRQGFRLIAAAAEGLLPGSRSTTLTISTSPSFAAKWLVPRLMCFNERHPEIDVRIDATRELVDFSRGGVDVAIRQGEGRYPGLHVEFLFRADLFPVCSRALLEGKLPLREPLHLHHHHLLHNRTEAEWSLWLSVHGVEGIDLTHGTRFSDDVLALEAAIQGHGVAITREPLAAGDLASGLLVRPFAESTQDLFAFHLVCPQGRANDSNIAAFRAWIVEEMREAHL